MQFQVIKVFTDNNKAVAYIVSNGQDVSTVDKERMFDAAKSGHTFTNASVNVEAGSVRVDSNVPREAVKSMDIEVLEILSADTTGQHLLYWIKMNGKHMTLMPDELNNLLSNPGCSSKASHSFSTAKKVIFGNVKENFFNTKWMHVKVSDRVLESVALWILMRYRGDAPNYMSSLKKSIDRDSKLGSANYDKCAKMVQANMNLI